jgi:DnaJ-domain-containing protein 1
LKDYFWFCRPHAEAYNKAWNFHAGMTQEQIEAQLQAAMLGERPLWPLGSRGLHGAARFARYRTGGFDPFEFMAREAQHDADAAARRASRGAANGGAGAHAYANGAAGGAEASPYATLGLAATADLATIKQQYKRLAKRYHPDANGGDKAAEEQLKRINEAYSTLKKLHLR